MHPLNTITLLQLDLLLLFGIPLLLLGALVTALIIFFAWLIPGPSSDQTCAHATCDNTATSRVGFFLHKPVCDTHNTPSNW